MKKERLEALSKILGSGENLAELERREYNRNLKAMAKRPEELVRHFDCRIKNALGEVEPIYELEHFSASDTLIGPGSWSQKEYSPVILGYKNNLKLEVKALESTIPVGIINFSALIPLEKGDFVRAFVIKGEYKSERRAVFLFDDEEGDKYLVERDYFAEERAFRLDKLRDSQVVACYIERPK